MPYEDMFENNSRVFLLTRVKHRRVKAERIRHSDDLRLYDQEPFALVSVVTVILNNDEMDLVEQLTGDIPDRLIEGVGAVNLLRERLANSLTGHNPAVFLGVLRDSVEDVVLERSEETDEWSVCKPGDTV